MIPRRLDADVVEAKFLLMEPLLAELREIGHVSAAVRLTVAHYA